MSAPSDKLFERLKTDQAIVAWARSNVDRIAKAYIQKGGWEGWAQVEIATALDDYRRGKGPIAMALHGRAEEALAAQMSEVSREQGTYTPTISAKGELSQMKADIVVKHGPSIAKEFIIIELKCEGFFNKDAFMKALLADVKKIDGDIKYEYKPARLWALGFSTSQEVFDKLSGWPGIEYSIISEPQQWQPGSYLNKQSVNMKLVLWTIRKGVVKEIV